MKKRSHYTTFVPFRGLLYIYTINQSAPLITLTPLVPSPIYIFRSFVIEKQPPQVIKTANRFSATVRLDHSSLSDTTYTPSGNAISAGCTWSVLGGAFLCFFCTGIESDSLEEVEMLLSSFRSSISSCLIPIPLPVGLISIPLLVCLIPIPLLVDMFTCV